MMEKLLEWDKQLFLSLNDLHQPWLDPVMFFLTHTVSWTPLFLFLLYLVARYNGKQSWILLIGLTLTILLSDQLTSTLMKPYFSRLRPSHEPALAGLVHIVNDYKGGKFGFASSHAANTFGAATFLFLLLRNNARHMGYLFAWATFVCFTRIYLGVHYPGDLLAGALIGTAFGWIFFYLSRKAQASLVRSA